MVEPTIVVEQGNVVPTTADSDASEERSVLLTLDPVNPDAPLCSGHDGCSKFFVELVGFAAGSHSVECWSDGSRFAVEQVSNWPAHVGCASTRAGAEVWVVVDGEESNRERTPRVWRERSVLLTLDPVNPDAPLCSGHDGCSKFFVELVGFAAGSHSVECWSDGSRFAVEQVSNWPAHVGCASTRAGAEVWVVVDGEESNRERTPRVVTGESGK